jgi:dipeptidase E
MRLYLSLYKFGNCAGIVVLTPSRHCSELVDDPHHILPGYDPAINWEGLGLLPYALMPHYKSNHPESATMDGVVQYFIDQHMLFKALRGGEASRVD